MIIQHQQGSYPIEIATGLRHGLKEKLESLGAHQIAIVIDANCYELYKNLFLEAFKPFKIQLSIIPSGEASKNHSNLMGLYKAWLDFGLSRGDWVVAIGGGVVGDLAGFGAATYLRGVKFIQVPTTLLSQVDSSIGGKVAINLPEGKNLVGSFFQPEAVWIDPDFIMSLSEREYLSGIGELIKAGAIGDKSLFELLGREAFRDLKSLKSNEILLLEAINKGLKVKAELVMLDPYEINERKLLNFGHTLGHAIEANGNFKDYTHGEAVAMGMWIMTKYAQHMGWTNKETGESLFDLLEKFNLGKNSEIDYSALMPWIMKDKKIANGNIDLVVLNTIGSANIKRVDLNIYLSELCNFLTQLKEVLE